MISKDLIAKTFNYFNQFKNEKVVINPSIPILYFGDLDQYLKSPLKIITVGKNPSKNEFRLKKNDNYSFVRFPKWDEEEKNLIETLNDYFGEKPLKSWFSSFEPILNGLNASYYQGYQTNTVVHTDICSPLATDPTWSKLNENERNLFFKEGLSIWKQLIEELEPDIMLVSFRKDIFNAVFNSSGKELLAIENKKNGEKRKFPYRVSIHEYPLNIKTVNVLFGDAANKPFDKISEIQKLEIGVKYMAHFNDPANMRK
jgi:hypothetical protein